MRKTRLMRCIAQDGADEHVGRHEGTRAPDSRAAVDDHRHIGVQLLADCAAGREEGMRLSQPQPFSNMLTQHEGGRGRGHLPMHDDTDGHGTQPPARDGLEGEDLAGGVGHAMVGPGSVLEVRHGPRLAPGRRNGHEM